MQKKTNFTFLFSVICILILIVNSHTAIDAAKEAMQLCIKVVIPSLFPLFVFSILLTGNMGSGDFVIFKPLGKLLGLPESCTALLITAFLGGYPSGAQCVAQAHQSGSIRKTEAERMLAYCSNAGPSFIFGILGGMFSHKGVPWVLWIIQILSAVCVGMLIRMDSHSAPVRLKITAVTPTEAINKSVKAMISVCGWVLLFRCLLTISDEWFLNKLPAEAKTVLIGMLELTNGCLALNTIHNEQLRFVLCAAMLSFGGLCVLMQTQAVANGLNLNFYLRGKLLQAGFSTVFSLTASYIVCGGSQADKQFIGFFCSAVCSITICVFCALKKKIAVAFPRSRVYNHIKQPQGERVCCFEKR